MRNKNLFLILFIMSSICFSRTESIADISEYFSGGEGSIHNPYIISSTEDLVALSAYVSSEDSNDLGFRSAYYLQINDIDMSSVERWVPIGEIREKAFSGTYDGGGNKIRNIRMPMDGEEPAYYLFGLFGAVTGDGENSGILKNINLETSQTFSCLLSTEKELILGSLIGLLDGGKVENCTNGDGAINGVMRMLPEDAEKIRRTDNISNFVIGGLIGVLEQGNVVKCVNNASIFIDAAADPDRKKSAEYIHGKVGGLIGVIQNSESTTGRKEADQPEINDSKNQGSINVTMRTGFVGGIVSVNSRTPEGVIKNCFNAGNLNIKTNSGIVCGGIAGRMSAGYFFRCKNIGNINVSSYGNNLKSVVIGGIGGMAYNIEQSMNIGDIGFSFDYKNVTGITSIDTGSYTMQLSVQVFCGGLTGRGKNISEALNTGNISGNIACEGHPANIYMGGLAGELGNPPGPYGRGQYLLINNSNFAPRKGS